MSNLMDLLTGRLFPKPGTKSKRQPCTPTPPKDPRPVKPGEPWCSTGPDLSKIGNELRRAAKKRK